MASGYDSVKMETFTEVYVEEIVFLFFAAH